jgi:uroporphyrinogen decarboxylase
MWLMRQAGRYLPEYRALRATKGGFLDSLMTRGCRRNHAQPLRRFAFDGAISSPTFRCSHAMGMDLTFVAGEGPGWRHAGRRSSRSQTGRKLDPIYETVRLVKGRLAPETTFLGLRLTLTVATYMIAGREREQAEARNWPMPTCRNGCGPDIVSRITVDYLSRQIGPG